MKYFYIIIFSSFSFLLNAQSFQTVPAGIQNCSQGGLSWGDYDNDGDLDVALSGVVELGAEVMIYRNKNGEFTKITTTIPGLTLGTVNWGDYDNDQDLDLLVCGTNSIGEGSTLLYRNDNGSFTEAGAGFTGIASGEAIWIDYNKDGLLDVFISGDTLYNTPVTKLYLNQGNGIFTHVPQNIPGYLEGFMDAGDYDNDGDPDLLISGTLETGFKTHLFRNDEGTFTDSEIPLFGVSYSDGIFVDYDTDGDLDLIYMGSTEQVDYRVKIYRNDGDETFTCSSDSLEGEWVGRIDAGDINNDGYPDLGITGSLCCGDALSRIYMNDGNGHFYLAPVSLPDLYFSQINFGDYDNDGDCDFLLFGIPPDGPGNTFTALYRNSSLSNTFTLNQPPDVPAGLSADVVSNDVTFTWDPATDNTTPSAGLTYSLRVGTAPGTADILNTPSDPATGHYRIYNHGNIFHSSSWKLKNLPEGTFYCAVQALDHTGTASEFSEEVMFTIGYTGTGTVVNSHYQIFPNPADDHVTISAKDNLSSSIDIIDIAGKKVLSMPVYGEKTIIEVKDLVPGIYLLKINEITNRLIISR